MANPIKGQVDFPVGEVTYRLRLSIEEIIKVENLLDVGIIQIAESLRNPKVGTLRALLWAALQEEHPEIDIVEAGQIVVAAGVLPTVKYLAEVINAAFPKAEGKESPSRKPGRGGSGKSSTSSSSRSASTRKAIGD